jgi:hypothetical protein
MNTHTRPFCSLLALLLGVLLSVGGCAGGSSGGGGAIGQWRSAPGGTLQTRSTPWDYQSRPGRLITTPHYVIYTTVTDAQLESQLPQVMELAFSQYQILTPGLAFQDQGGGMPCYIFGTRPEWMDYTRRTTGADAKLYLAINRGGFTIRDQYVAYQVGVRETLSVAAHEGWHQYCSRHFKGRLPPFLEEGFACTFETIRFEGGQPQLNSQLNGLRAQQLRKSSENGALWSLRELSQLHAGMVVTRPGPRIEAFYAQSWAFARFLQEGVDGKYRPRLQQLITDLSRGTVADPTGSHTSPGGPWLPGSAPLLLEHYLGAPIDQVDAEFRVFMHQIAYDEFARHFQP